MLSQNLIKTQQVIIQKKLPVDQKRLTESS